MGQRLGSQFFRFWLAGTATNLADGIAAASFPLLAATLTRDPFLIAAATFIYRLPWLVFEVFAGEIVDRTDRRLAMFWGNVARAATAASLAVAVVTDHASLSMLYLFAFTLGAAETVTDTSWDALLPNLVERTQLESANGWNEAAESTANDMVGPVVGGFLFGIAAAGPFAFDAALFALAAVIVWNAKPVVRTPRGESVSLGAIKRDIWEGLRWVFTHRVTRTIAFAGGIGNFLGTAQLSVFVLLAQEELGLGDVGFGLALSAAGIGGVIGAGVAGWIERTFGPGRTVLASAIAGTAVSLTLAIASSPILAGGAFGLFGFSVGVWNVVVVSLRQELTPDHLRGRVTADARVITFGAIPLGALAGGVLAETFGIRAPYVAAAVVGGLVALILSRVATNERIAVLRNEGN